MHPLIKTVMVNESLNSAAALAAFDLVLSMSSFEHDGLGRYGDPLNPNGDIMAMRSTRRLLKQGTATAASVQLRAHYALKSVFLPNCSVQAACCCSRSPAAPTPSCGTSTACTGRIACLSSFAAGG
jgi:hypothetical protein